MKQILIDMDGVLADLYAQFINYEYKETGKKLTKEELMGIKEHDAFPHYDKHINTPGFFKTMPIMPDCIDGLKYLNDKYKVYIVSSATEFPNSLHEKLEWLNKLFSFISWKQMIFCGDKSPITGDIMIDDHTKNFKNFEGEKLLFTQPHNINLSSSEFVRINNWEQVKKIL